MTGEGQQVHVFLDRNRLEEGRIFSSDFANALIKSLVVVPILSSAALDRMFDLKSDSNRIRAYVYRAGDCQENNGCSGLASVGDECPDEVEKSALTSSVSNSLHLYDKKM